MILLRFLAICGAMTLTDAAMAQPLAKQLFGAKKVSSQQKPAAFGSYSRGCAAGSVQLPETGSTWQAMRLSRNRNWGHPQAIDYVQDLSKYAARQSGWSGLYIGDISQPRGGPMASGHRSHQLGLDIDIWMLPGDNMRLSRKARENISSISLRRSNGAHVNANWTKQHHSVLRKAAKDKRVARIFVFPGAKVQMCNDEEGNRAYLRKIRPWWGHHYHFHVRLKCPKGSHGCVDQDPPPKGDGCAEAKQWVKNILNPPPPDPNAPKPKKRREYRLVDLPQQCTAVLQSN